MKSPMYILSTQSKIMKKIHGYFIKTYIIYDVIKGKFHPVFGRISIFYGPQGPSIISTDG